MMNSKSCPIPPHCRLALALLATAILPGLWAVPAARAQSAASRFQSEIEAFEQSDRTNPPPRGAILFIGSSSIRLWKTLAQDFPRHRVINRGFGGSQIIDSVNYVDRIVFPYQPELIVFYAGGNDINDGKSPEQVFANYKTFVTRVQTRLPATRIAYISIAPNPARWAQVEKVRQANHLIETYAHQQPGLAFINVFPRMLGTDGLPRPEIFGPDRLHMNEKGYALWKEIVGPALER
jgi:lysophospholipase L1-like esterase